MKSFGSLTVLFALALLLGACTSVTPEGEGTPAAEPTSHRHRTVGLARTAGLMAEPSAEQPTESKKEETPEPEVTAVQETPPADSPEAQQDDSSGFFSWLFGGSKDEEETPAQQAVEVKPEVAPTPAQQAAAQRALRETPSIPEPRTESAAAELTPWVDDVDYAPAPTRNGLRLGNFAPPEEAASRAESPTPRPNAVELRGLRSPTLHGGRLPMDINGKLTTDNEDHE